ncbi:MAG TPA: ABC transporter permease [Bacteroidales bacterium]|nr:ABC transporter permease [Bacteroidales bacterium]
MVRRLVNNQLLQLANALSKEILREPGVLFWGILFPILMSIGLGIAFTKKTDVLRKVAVIMNPDHNPGDTLNNFSVKSFLETYCERIHDPSDKSDTWKYVLTNRKLGNSVFYFTPMDWDQAMIMLKRGTLNVIIKENNEMPEYYFDPQNPDAQLTYIKLSSVIGGDSRQTNENDINIKPLMIAGTRYIDFLIPGLITMGVMMSCMWGISYSLIEKRSKKLLRRLVATPMKKSNFLLALLTVRIMMNFAESLILLIFAVLAFKIRIQGDPTSLILVFLAGNLAFCGIAIFVSSHTSNTEVGNGLINAVTYPMMVLSGIFFSYHNFPGWSIKIIQALPLTILTDAVRSVFNEGAGFRETALSFMILISTGAFFFAAGLKIFKWH